VGSTRCRRGPPTQARARDQWCHPSCCCTQDALGRRQHKRLKQQQKQLQLEGAQKKQDAAQGLPFVRLSTGVHLLDPGAAAEQASAKAREQVRVRTRACVCRGVHVCLFVCVCVCDCAHACTCGCKCAKNNSRQLSGPPGASVCLLQGLHGHGPPAPAPQLQTLPQRTHVCALKLAGTYTHSLSHTHIFPHKHTFPPTTGSGACRRRGRTGAGPPGPAALPHPGAALHGVPGVCRAHAHPGGLPASVCVVFCVCVPQQILP